MATPVNPEKGRSSVRPNPVPAAPRDSSSKRTPASAPESTPTTPPIILPTADDDTSPTVISNLRNKITSVDAAHAETLTGRRLGQYELMESIGVGGMAAVIKAQDLELGRVVALKILPPDMAIDPENIVRFKQEARAAARLDHENVARVYNCGEDQGLHFIAFEFVEGEDLRARMIKHVAPLPVAESVHYLMQVAAGLSHAASRGVVHRDIKPSNIVITPEGKAKIVDMGLARNLDARASNGQLTQSGVTLGTFDYISPEQAIEPRSADIRSDIYSLGCTFYHVLTGHPPVPEGTAAKKLHCQQHVAPLDPRSLNHVIPDELAAILGRMMQKDPDKRYQHPDHLLAHLLSLAEKLKLPSRPAISESARNHLRYLDNPLPSPPRSSPLLIGIAAVLAALGVYAIHVLQSKDPLEPRPMWGETDKAPHRSQASAQNSPPLNNPVNPPLIQNPGMVVHEARTATELVQYLKQSSTHIKLTPRTVYDFSKAGKKEIDIAPLFTGKDLLLECDPTNDPPTIRLNVAGRDGAANRKGAFVIRGMEGGNCTAQFRRIRFEFTESSDTESSFAGIQFEGVKQVSFEDCWFIPQAKKNAQVSPANWCVGANSELRSKVELSRCYFAPGAVAMRLEGRADVNVVECAFAPQSVIFQVQSLDTEPVQITLERSTAMMLNGAIVELDNQVPCKVQAGNCLFASLSTEPSEIGCLIRQNGERAEMTRYEGAMSIDGVPQPNGYRSLCAYTSDDQQSYSFEECAQKDPPIPIKDAAARIFTANPFSFDRDRFDPDQLKDIRQLGKTFKLNLRLPELRLDPHPDQMILGTMFLPGSKVRFYDNPLVKPALDKKLPANVKVWDPNLKPEEAKAPYFAKLADAIKALDEEGRKTNGIVQVRCSGRVAVPPQELDVNMNLIIRPDEQCKPIFYPKRPDGIKPHQEIFKLFGGKITFEQINFDLTPIRERVATSIVSLSGAGECTFRNCSITLEDHDELAAVSLGLGDPQQEKMMMMMEGADKTAPTINFENVFIRGRGEVIRVRSSRTFQCKAANTLVVLDGNFLTVEPTQMDLAAMNPSVVKLDNITTFLSRQLVHQTASEKKLENKGLGLVQVQVQPTNCLFVPVGETHAPLIYLDHIDTLDQVEKVFSWKEAPDQQNLLGYKQEEDILLEIRPDGENAMQMERIVADRWKQKWRVENRFGEVKFVGVEPEFPKGRNYSEMRPGDFELGTIDGFKLPKEKSVFGAKPAALQDMFWTVKN